VRRVADEDCHVVNALLKSKVGKVCMMQSYIHEGLAEDVGGVEDCELINGR